MTSPVNIRIITAQEVIPIRQIILRPNRPVGDCVFAHDADAETRHFGAFAGGVMVGVASLYHLSPPGTTDVNAWQLRGMAVLENTQRHGIGSALLRACCEHVVECSGTMMWFNARTGAVPFYAKHGFEIIGAEFIIPDVGQHYVMHRQLSQYHRAEQEVLQACELIRQRVGLFLPHHAAPITSCVSVPLWVSCGRNQDSPCTRSTTSMRTIWTAGFWKP